MFAVPARPDRPLAACLGIGSRRFAGHLPGFVASYAGDTLWALAAFLGIGLLLPMALTVWVALRALSFLIIIEVSQLYHAHRIDSIRSTTVGGLILGYDFVWSDLACYDAGVDLGILIERIASHGRPAQGACNASQSSGVSIILSPHRRWPSKPS